MHLISAKALADASLRFPQYADELLQLGKTIEKGYFPDALSMRRIFPSLDNLKYLDKHYVIDIAGNHLRLIALIFFARQKFYVRHIYTHREYDDFVARCRTKGKSPWM